MCSPMDAHPLPPPLFDEVQQLLYLDELLYTTEFVTTIRKESLVPLSTLGVANYGFAVWIDDETGI